MQASDKQEVLPSMTSTELAGFIDEALRRCADGGKSLRAVARESKIPPSMISQMRYGKTGVPMLHLSGLSSALSLSQAEHLEFIRLVRSDQAKRAVHRGTDYVAELEAELKQVRQLVSEVDQWIFREKMKVPQGIVNGIRAILRYDETYDFVPKKPNSQIDQRGMPWDSPQIDDNSDLESLEARNVAGHVVMAEYRVRIYDKEGLLLHGEVLVCLGVEAAVQNVLEIYRADKLGKWKKGWYRWEILRKAIPTAVVIRYIEMP